MKYDGDLRQAAYTLASKGKNRATIAKELGVSKSTVGRWLDAPEFVGTTTSISVELRETADPLTWFNEAVLCAEDMAASSGELRQICCDLLKGALAEPEINVRLVTCLSLTLERLFGMEWRSRGLDALDPNRSIARVLAMGMTVHDSQNSITAENQAED